jgi:hypothetical protein
MRHKIPTGQIDWIVNRHHVGDTDAEVQADIERRMSDPKFTPAIQRRCIAYALKQHKRNRTLFLRVMRGG